MSVKVFSTQTPEELETTVQSWLDANPSIVIKSMAAGHGFGTFITVIIYS